jgi:Protein of unknown function (DUF1376)
VSDNSKGIGVPPDGGDPLPEPLTPPDCNLGGMTFMPLDIVRLRDSDFYILSTGDEFKAGVSLWTKAFLQVPAGSLPDDDRILAHMSGAGPAWPTVREMALRGFVKCSDGRLYHRVVCEKAAKAWQQRIDFQTRTKAATAARAAKRQRDVDRDVVRGDERDVHQGIGTGTGTGTEERTLLRSDAPASADPSMPAGLETEDAREAVWVEGLATLQRATGKPNRAARSLLGKLLKFAKDDCAAVLHAIRECPPTGDPIAWLTAAAKARGNPTRSRAEGIRNKWGLSNFADPSLLADNSPSRLLT